MPNKHLTCLTCKTRTGENLNHLRSDAIKRSHAHDGHELVNCQCSKPECQDRFFKVPLPRSEQNRAKHARYREKNGSELLQYTNKFRRDRYVPKDVRVERAKKEVADTNLQLELFDEEPLTENQVKAKIQNIMKQKYKNGCNLLKMKDENGEIEEAVSHEKAVKAEPKPMPVSALAGTKSTKVSSNEPLSSSIAMKQQEFSANVGEFQIKPCKTNIQNFQTQLRNLNIQLQNNGRQFQKPQKTQGENILSHYLNDREPKLFRPTILQQRQENWAAWQKSGEKRDQKKRLQRGKDIYKSSMKKSYAENFYKSQLPILPNNPFTYKLKERDSKGREFLSCTTSERFSREFRQKHGIKRRVERSECSSSYSRSSYASTWSVSESKVQYQTEITFKNPPFAQSLQRQSEIEVPVNNEMNSQRIQMISRTIQPRLGQDLCILQKPKQLLDPLSHAFLPQNQRPKKDCIQESETSSHLDGFIDGRVQKLFGTNILHVVDPDFLDKFNKLNCSCGLCEIIKLPAVDDDLTNCNSVIGCELTKQLNQLFEFDRPLFDENWNQLSNLRLKNEEVCKKIDVSGDWTKTYQILRAHCDIQMTKEQAIYVGKLRVFTGKTLLTYTPYVPETRRDQYLSSDLRKQNLARKRNLKKDEKIAARNTKLARVINLQTPADLKAEEKLYICDPISSRTVTENECDQSLTLTENEFVSPPKTKEKQKKKQTICKRSFDRCEKFEPSPSKGATVEEMQKWNNLLKK